MKLLVKKLVKGFMLIGMMVLMTGCAPAEKSDQEIKDVVAFKFDQDYSNVSFTSRNVILDQRQTNKDDKTDFAWVRVVAENDTARIECLYEVTCILYNDGWQVEECEREEYSCQILKSTVTEEEAMGYVIENFPDVYDEIYLANRDTDLDYSGDDMFQFVGVYRDGYAITYDKIEVWFEYGLRSGWQYENIDRTESIKTEWDISGTWAYNSGNENVKLVIHELNEDTAMIEYDFSVERKNILGIVEKYENTSDGIVCIEDDSYYNGDDKVTLHVWGGDGECYFRIDKNNVEFGVSRTSIGFELTYQGE